MRGYRDLGGINGSGREFGYRLAQLGVAKVAGPEKRSKYTSCLWQLLPELGKLSQR